MIEVYKTNVQTGEDARAVIDALLKHLPTSKINFDLDDCDKILRIDAEIIFNHRVIQIMHTMNYQCEALPD